MAEVDVDGSSLLANTAQVDWLCLRVGGHLVHSSSELSKQLWPSRQHHKNCRGIVIITALAITECLSVISQCSIIIVGWIKLVFSREASFDLTYFSLLQGNSGYYHLELYPKP